VKKSEKAHTKLRRTLLASPGMISRTLEIASTPGCESNLNLLHMENKWNETHSQERTDRVPSITCGKHSRNTVDI